MRYQPPGSLSKVSFTSLRYVELLRHPWLHMAHADSFWTELYGRMWFDYEGLKTTLSFRTRRGRSCGSAARRRTRSGVRSAGRCC